MVDSQASQLPGADSVEESRMSLGDHLNELRGRLFKGVLTIFVVFVAGFGFREQISLVVLDPLRQAQDRVRANDVDYFEGVLAGEIELKSSAFFSIAGLKEQLSKGEKLKRSVFFLTDDPADKRVRAEYSSVGRTQSTGAGERFFFEFKLVLLFALVVGAPVLLWQLWQFVAAGLYPPERKALLRHFPFAILLLAAGVVFGYFVMLPWAMFFLNNSKPGLSQWTQKLSEYLTLVTNSTLALGVIFQLPLLMHALIKLDVVPRETFKVARPYFIVGAFVFSAIMTPPDPYTQAMMAVPMVVLYEVGLLSTAFTKKSKLEPESAA